MISFGNVPSSFFVWVHYQLANKLPKLFFPVPAKKECTKESHNFCYSNHTEKKSAAQPRLLVPLDIRDIHPYKLERSFPLPPSKRKELNFTLYILYHIIKHSSTVDPRGIGPLTFPCHGNVLPVYHGPICPR